MNKKQYFINKDGKIMKRWGKGKDALVTYANPEDWSETFMKKVRELLMKKDNE